MKAEAALIAKQLKLEADHLIYEKGIDTLLRQYGQVIYTGSYVLDLMAWPDIDITLILHGQNDYEAQLLDLGKEFLKYPELLSLKLERDFRRRNPKCPKGYYLQIKLATDKWQSPWKLDIWVFSAADIERNLELIRQIKQRLTPELRKLILEIKQSLITEEGRTPSFSGYYIYQAVLFKGMRDIKTIYSYLKEQGVEVAA